MAPGYRQNSNLKIYIAELDTRLGNKASNKLTVGLTQQRDFRSPQSSSTDFPLVDIIGPTGNVYTSFGYEPFTFNNKLFMDSYQLSDIFNFYKGSHEITVGTQNSYKKYQNAFAPGFAGAYQFSSISAFENGVPASAYAASYSTLKGGGFPFAYAGATNLSLFAQDKYRATPNFTLTYGIRFDYTSYQDKFTDNPSFDALTFLNGATYNVGSAPNGFLVISPRAGFNWNINGDRTWQLRGGAGIFEGAPPFVWIENQAANNGVQFGSFTLNQSSPIKAPPFIPSTAGSLAYYLSGGNGSQPPVTQTSTPIGYSVNVVDKGFKYPTKLRTSLGLDKRVGDWVFTTEFTYSKDINATYMANANLNESNGPAYAVTNGPDTRQRYITDPTSTTGSNSSNKYYNGNTLADPNLGNMILLGNTNKGWSYDATVRAQKTFGRLTASISYNFSDVKTAMENGSTASTLWASRAVANTDPNARLL